MFTSTNNPKSIKEFARMSQIIRTSIKIDNDDLYDENQLILNWRTNVFCVLP